MLHTSFEANNIGEVNDFLSSNRIQKLITKSKSILVQVFASKPDESFTVQLSNSVRKAIPSAIIIGTTTLGEITEGKTISESTVLSLSFFEEAGIEVIAMDCPYGCEREVGESMAKRIMEIPTVIKGVFLLVTTQTVNGGKLLDGIFSTIGGFPLFGAGAGCYGFNNDSFIFFGNRIYRNGLISVVFSGERLNIEAYTCLGWQALSKEMTVTEAEDYLLVKKIDNAPAVLVYEKYLKIDTNDNFFNKVIEFPLIIKRDGCELARVPAYCAKDGTMCFGADIRNGEKVRLAYGNPQHIILNTYETQQSMEKFGPQGIFLYSCITRKILLQESIQLETQPFQDIAHTSGFYTFGGFFGRGKRINMLNAAIVAVGFREGDYKKKKARKAAKGKSAIEKELLEISPTARLLHFIEAVVTELEDANKKLLALSEMDTLTQLYNRRKIDSILRDEIKRVKRYNTSLSVILLDIDNFKSVNDMYGHYVGDTVLHNVASTLKYNIRKTDSVGRWGGEEFMIILPNTDLQMAGIMAERIREILSKTDFKPAGNITASFGVVAVGGNETELQVYNRVDAALYEAKHKGRNKIVLG